MSLGKNIKKHRRIAGLTQDQLAINCGLSRVGISDLERGIYQPKISTLRTIAKQLNVDIGILLA